MESFIKEYRYENGDIQKVQVVNLDSWSDLKFMRPEYSKEGFTKLCDLYENFIIKKFAAIFGKIVLFTVPENMEVPFESDTPYGKVLSPLSKANIALRKNSYVKGGKILFKDKMTEDFFNELKEKGCLRIAEGKRNSVTFSPVGNCFGFLSENHRESPFKVNSSFFIMDQFDLGSVYDEISVPLGLAVQDGVILNPPQFGREVLAVDRNDNIRITDIGLKDIGVVIDGVTYEHKKNAVFFERPEKRKTDRGGFDIAVVNNRVAALKKGGQTEIPSGGFVLKLENEIEIKDTAVSYCGLEELRFAVQVGNSAVRNGRETKDFISQFYHFLKPWTVSYPPTFYPLDYKKGRAPRIVFGEAKDGRPVCLWFEGAGKFNYRPGTDSCGASLSEAAAICMDLGIWNAVHLDGGGSAQIIFEGKRELMVSDRNAEDFSEAERAISMGIYI